MKLSTRFNPYDDDPRLTDEEEACVLEFINEVPNALPFIAVKCLMARKFDVERAVKLYHNYTSLVDKYGFRGIRLKDVLSQLKKKKMYIPGSRDKEDCTIFVLNVKDSLPGKDKADEILRLAFYLSEVALASMRTQRRGITILTNMDGLSWANYDREFQRMVLDFFQNNVPALVKKILIFKAPWWMNMILNVSYPFMKDKMKKRIFLVENLEEHIYEDQIPIEFGGTWEYDHESWIIHQLEYENRKLKKMEERASRPKRPELQTLVMNSAENPLDKAKSTENDIPRSGTPDSRYSNPEERAERRRIIEERRRRKREMLEAEVNRIAPNASSKSSLNKNDDREQAERRRRREERRRIQEDRERTSGESSRSRDRGSNDRRRDRDDERRRRAEVPNERQQRGERSESGEERRRRRERDRTENPRQGDERRSDSNDIRDQEMREKERAAREARRRKAEEAMEKERQRLESEQRKQQEHLEEQRLKADSLKRREEQRQIEENLKEKREEKRKIADEQREMEKRRLLQLQREKEALEQAQRKRELEDLARQEQERLAQEQNERERRDAARREESRKRRERERRREAIENGKRSNDIEPDKNDVNEKRNEDPIKNLEKSPFAGLFRPLADKNRVLLESTSASESSRSRKHSDEKKPSDDDSAWQDLENLARSASSSLKKKEREPPNKEKDNSGFETLRQELEARREGRKKMVINLDEMLESSGKDKQDSDDLQKQVADIQERRERLRKRRESIRMAKTDPKDTKEIFQSIISASKSKPDFDSDRDINEKKLVRNNLPNPIDTNLHLRERERRRERERERDEERGNRKDKDREENRSRDRIRGRERAEEEDSNRGSRQDSASSSRQHLSSRERLEERIRRRKAQPTTQTASDNDKSSNSQVRIPLDSSNEALLSRDRRRRDQ